MKFPKYEMNRKNFALTFLGGLIITALCVTVLTSEASYLFGFIFFVIIVHSSLLRLENIGKSKLWFFGVVVPLLNLYIILMLWSYPPNVKENGMDKKAYFISILVLLWVINGFYWRITEG